MIEDNTQIRETKKMVPPPNQLQMASTSERSSRKLQAGGNSQLDVDRNSRIVAAGHHKGGNKKLSKNNRQVQTGRREQTVTKNHDKRNSNVSKRGDGFTKKNDYVSSDIHDLLNFQYASISRPFINGQQAVYGRGRKRTTTFNKEAFLQANCHFVVDESKQYCVNAIDPDVLVDWNDIQLVYLPSHDAPTCPICLYPPIAGKITRCGHIFCWSCMLHYLNLGEKSWRKCPICHEALHEHDLKSVVSCVRKKYSRLDQITMNLMKRSKDSLFAVPIEEWSDDVRGTFPVWKDEPLRSGYKLALSSKQSVLEKILIREKSELEVQLSVAVIDKTGEDCFIEAAIEKLKMQIDNVKQALGLEVNALEPEDNKALTNHSTYGEDRFLTDLLAANDVSDKGAFSDTEEVSEESSLSPIACADDTQQIMKDYIEDIVEVTDEKGFQSRNYGLSESSTGSWGVGEHTRSVLDEAPTKDVGSYYFYQADDGQNIYIHSVNARCLIEEYGSLADGPIKITGQIIDFECFTMTKELRKRFRYLSHLPLSCEFVVVEVMLRPPVLSKHTIQNFMGEFKKRKDSRNRKLDEQKKFDRRATALQNKQLGFSSPYYEDEESIHIDLNDNTDFPQHLSPDIPRHLSPTSTEGKLSDEGSEVNLGPSFAQILRAESAIPITSKKNTSSPVWVKQRLPEASLISRPRGDGNDSDEGPDLVAPSYKDMFTAAMLTAPLPATTGQTGEKKSSNKKKKNKGILLFGTGGQRKY